MLVKKYGNRRLYDTETSRYVTLEEIAERVHHGEELRVVDAKTGHDLTQVTLAQIILEGRGAAKLLPVPLLKQLVRMRDDALADFFGRYVTWALEVYLRLRSGTRSVLPFDPLAGLSFAPPVLSRFFGGRSDEAPSPPPPAPEPAPEPARAPEEAHAADASDASEIAALRRELDELKAAVMGSRGRKTTKVRRARKSSG
ncbi:MAG: hypothetical protein H6710_00200 [Myxococcales bacterium]|nr:hypothetical protein [Myxococcales bacterium]MCB9703196.1 hypothetical protein [Myxococcales bacterium]